MLKKIQEKNIQLCTKLFLFVFLLSFGKGYSELAVGIGVPMVVLLGLASIWETREK